MSNKKNLVTIDKNLMSNMGDVGSVVLIFFSFQYFSVLFVFVLCLMLPMSRLSILDFSFVHLSCVLCCLCLDCPVLISLLFICPVFYVPNVASVSGLPIIDCPFCFL
jgi:hypothetical protein